MRFLTGDDTGILKWVRVEAQKVERVGGPRRRGDAVERLCWAGPESERETRIAIGYASGTVEVREAASGTVLGSYSSSPSIRCLQHSGSNLVAVSKDGTACILADWCAEKFTSSPAQGVKAGEDGEGAEGEPKEPKEPKEEQGVRLFHLPGPVSSAQLEPAVGSQRIAFGGGENDIKVFDFSKGEKGEVTWKAKNMPENFLCLRIPLKITTIQWATGCAPERSLLLVGTSDGKVRLYDASLQRRPLFECLIGHKSGQGSGGFTGCGDDTSRPVNCSVVHKTHNGDWSIFIGNTMGVLREYELKNCPDCKAAPVVPGRKKHLDWAAKKLPLRRGYRGIMGAIRSVDVHDDGSVLAAVGLGRFAYVFATKKRKMVCKVYLKQKLCSILLSAEPYNAAKGADPADDEDDDGEVTGEEKDGDAAGEGAGEGDIAPEDKDEVQEGFSDDDNDGEEGGEADDAEGDKEELDEVAAAEAAAVNAKRRTKTKLKRKLAAAPKGEAKAGPRKKAKKASDEGDIAPEDKDEVQEGFSDDDNDGEEGGEADDAEGDKEELDEVAAAEAAAVNAKRRTKTKLKRKLAAAPKGEAKAGPRKKAKKASDEGDIAPEDK
eukprot:CAMPEP_0177403878 /NCGR_PEP_ID=MMETSP0368-20130122/61099_1 /TAXON_ID=447022 ORGANISM="Scrippsiella hangoei-like, Strain SHHI-4" /NCGR_SAMPLE_ID=MMETSP0368 /ASSEMBLY_ACC=CAM_ASM_000363 /LENGTH=603 /DNA_ID=CAMNT_0018871917 /DNA_START=38 /DNA_END=1848 /DNA_ORIENTATION=-